MLKVEVGIDQDPMNPRTTYDNLGTMVCFHGKYDLGDKDHGFTTDDFSGWDDMANSLINDHDAGAMLTIYMYDHSGLTISTSPFTCPWDSGQVGYIYVTKEKIAKEYGEWNPENQVRALECLQAEIREYDAFISGMVYEYRVIDTETGDVIDSCGGYHTEEEARKEGEAAAEYYRTDFKENA